MHPGLSVIFLTTLIGAGQGLFLALYGAELASLAHGLTAPPGTAFWVGGSLLSLVLTGMGAVASLFHLGHPERAWRAMAMWRTSWLSREGIVLLAFAGLVFAYGLAHWFGSPASTMIGGLAALLCLTLFICTAMIYACVRFLQEWASPLTVANFVLLGCASGLTLASAFAAVTAEELVGPYALCAVIFTLLGLATRSASLLRNARIKHKSSLQTATGIHHPRIVQKSQGFTGSSYNTREFFHRRGADVLRNMKWIFLALAFVVPLALLALGWRADSSALLALAFAVQYIGLLAERWFFFAQARHPQNLYYQAIS